MKGMALEITSEAMGYAHADYADSLREFGEPRELPHCGGWILVRPIPGTPFKDAAGCYPLFACRNWIKLREDMEHIGSDLVSLVLVTDPFSAIDRAHLERCFDLVKPFKTHYIADLRHSLNSVISRGYRYNVRKSLKTMDVEVSCQPAKYLDDWTRLYENLIVRHTIKGISAFSRKSFEIQLNIPGMIMVLGRCKGEIVGATLVLIHDRVAYSHLSAYSDKGYSVRASYGIYWKTLSYLYEQGIRYFDNGGTAGTKEDPEDGLAQFKRGWSNNRRTVFFCGRVFDRQKYALLCDKTETAGHDYFPGYRTEAPQTHPY